MEIKMSEVMDLELTKEEMSEVNFRRKFKLLEEKEGYKALADYGLRDAILAKPSVISDDNEVAYEMMFNEAREKMRAEMLKQSEKKVDEPVKEIVKAKAPLNPSNVDLSETDTPKVNINSMDIFDNKKMKPLNVTEEVQIFLNINRPEQENNYGI